MNKLSKMRLCALGSAMLLASGAGMAQDRPEFVPHELLVKFKPETRAAVVESVLSSVSASTLKRFRLNPLYHVKLSSVSLQSAVERILADHPDVEYVQKNYLRYLDATPNDPLYGLLYGMHNTGQTGGSTDADIDAPQAWSITTGSSNVVVAVIDSGMDMNHEDLAANLWTNSDEIAGNGIDDDGNGYVDDVHGWDFTGNDNNPDDDIFACGGHGTHVSGTIGAVGNNGIGVVGVNWNVRIMPLKATKATLGIFCSLPDSATIGAVEYAAANGAEISNNSYGGGAFSQASMDTIKASRKLFIAAAGNNGANNDSSPQYPANYDLDNIMSVAATTDIDTLASFSNYGTNTVDIGAPGDEIYSTLPDNQYGYLSGTSMATPMVVGAAALVYSTDFSLTPNELRWQLENSADNIGIPVATSGRLNVNDAIAMNQRDVEITMTALGSTTVNPGDTINYRVTISNNTGSTQSFNADVVALPLTGNEVALQGQPLTLPGGNTVTADFSVAVPSGAASGNYYLLGRINDLNNPLFDENMLTYRVR